MLKLKKSNFMFSNRNHSKKGMLSTFLAVLTIITLLILSILSSRTGGNGSMLLGGFGLCALILSIAGFMIGLQSLKEEEVYYSFPVVGTTLNTIILVVYLIIYIMGMLL